MTDLTDAQRLQVVDEIWDTTSRDPSAHGLLHEYERIVRERMRRAETGEFPVATDAEGAS